MGSECRACEPRLLPCKGAGCALWRSHPLVTTDNSEVLGQSPASGAGVLGRALPAVAANRLTRGLWRYRTPIFGLIGFGLALYGEQMMRATPGGPPTNPELGTRLAQI